MFARKGLVVTLVVFLGLMIMPLAAQEDVSFPTTEWRVSTPEAQGMDSAEVAGLITQFAQPHYNLTSLLVIRHGNVVAEAYSPLVDASTLQDTWNVGMNVTSALIGILLRDGDLESLDTPVLSLFPERTVQNLDANKEAMTVRHVLNMTSGFACDDLFHVTHTGDDIVVREDGLQYVLDLPMGSAPGSEYHFCAASTHLLSAIITELTGMTAAEFAQEKLFGPLGITNYAWMSSPQGLTLGYAGLRMNPRDLAKIGYLYLQSGMWEGEQIIPADYVEASLTAQVNPGWPDMECSYQWWHGTSTNTSIAIGFGGQYLLLAPGKDLIVVMSSSVPEEIRPMVQGYPFIYAAAGLTTTDTAHPENSAGLQQLEAVIAKIEAPVAMAPAALPDLAAQISGQMYGLMMFTLPAEDMTGYLKPVNVSALRFDFTDSAQASVTLIINDEAWTAPIGLDERYAISEGPLGVVGIRGGWSSQTEFTMQMRYAGDVWNVNLDVLFLPGAIRVVTSEYSNRSAAITYGMMAQ